MLLVIDVGNTNTVLGVYEGIKADFDRPTHEVLGGTPAEWPSLLGYNRVIAKPEATTVARAGDDPLLVVGQAGEGRSVAFTSDLAPHWAPPEFVGWPHYQQFWASVLRWAARASS